MGRKGLARRGLRGLAESELVWRVIMTPHEVDGQTVAGGANISMVGATIIVGAKNIARDVAEDIANLAAKKFLIEMAGRIARPTAETIAHLRAEKVAEVVARVPAETLARTGRAKCRAGTGTLMAMLAGDG